MLTTGLGVLAAMFFSLFVAQRRVTDAALRRVVALERLLEQTGPILAGERGDVVRFLRSFTLVAAERAICERLAADIEAGEHRKP